MNIQKLPGYFNECTSIFTFADLCFCKKLWSMLYFLEEKLCNEDKYQSSNEIDGFKKVYICSQEGSSLSKKLPHRNVVVHT